MPDEPPRPLPMLLAALICLVVVTLPGCGDDPPRHGLESRKLASQPTGDALTARFDVRDGAAWRARIHMTMDVTRKGTQGGRPKDIHRSGSAVFVMTWRFHRTAADAAPSSEITLKYVEAEGDNADAYLARETLHGTLEHGLDGRVKPETLTVRGGLREHQKEAHYLIRDLLLAGFGGAPPWTPSRPIRQGEAWALEDFIRPRGMESVERYCRNVGLQGLEPTFEGTARLAAVHDDGEGGERLLDLELDALIEVEGPISHAGSHGDISMGYHTEGRATVSAVTGVPRAFDVTQTVRTRVHAEGESMEDLVVSRIHGEVERIAK